MICADRVKGGLSRSLSKSGGGAGAISDNLLGNGGAGANTATNSGSGGSSGGLSGLLGSNNIGFPTRSATNGSLALGGNIGGGIEVSQCLSGVEVDHLISSHSVVDAFGGFHPPVMPLARTKSLLATLNSDTNPIVDAALSNVSLNANNSVSQNFIFENCIPATSAAVVSVGISSGGGSGQSALLPPLGQMPAMKTTGSTQFTQLYGDDNSNPEHNGTATNTLSRGGPLVSTNESTTLPVVRPSSVESISVKNGSARQPKTYVATPEQVMKYYMNKLTPYEHKEIFTYNQIYFIGANAKKRPGIVDGNQASNSNYGYDDHQGSYIHIPHDHIQYRYEVLKVIGKGSFGQVLKSLRSQKSPSCCIENCS